MTDKLQAIREKCIEANPAVNELYEYCGWHTDMEGNFESCKQCVKKPRTIRLADVLLAIDHHCSDWMDEEGSAIAVTQHGGIWDLKDATVENNWTDYPNVGHWDLRNDDLEKQSPETIEFLHNLLCV